MTNLNHQDLLDSHVVLTDWLQLARSENVGPLTFHNLLKKYGTAKKALEALPSLAAYGGLKRPLKIASRLEVEKELEQIHAFGAHLLPYSHPLYPSLLKHIDSAPPLLTVKGRLELLTLPSFAIVGARNASILGKKLAYTFAKQLGEKGWIIISGLARGIDTSAHQGSLATGTVAVLAGGIDQIYPQENESLQHQISQTGALVAESPFGIAPHSSLFPRRNRIISGMSQGILVVEAALKSGSLSTAHHALEQAREIFAIPGYPLDPRAQGCNKLIKNGAILVDSLEDITNILSPCPLPPLPEPELMLEDSSPSSSLETTRQLIYETLSFLPINIDELIRECHLPPGDAWTVLLEMEVAGRVERHPGSKVSLNPDWSQNP